MRRVEEWGEGAAGGGFHVEEQARWRRGVEVDEARYRSLTRCSTPQAVATTSEARHGATVDLGFRSFLSIKTLLNVFILEIECQKILRIFFKLFANFLFRHYCETCCPACSMEDSKRALGSDPFSGMCILHSHFFSRLVFSTDF
jgi:hypothetical protein